MQIFVSGTWRPEKAAAYTTQARELGQLLAREGFDLACGPGTGIARYVIDGFRHEPSRGSVRYYLPHEAEMTAVGEEVADGADEICRTEFDYPMRNVWQVKQSDGVFALTGGDGTLEELLPALIDYKLPVAVVRDAGSAAKALAVLLDIYPEWSDLVHLGDDVSSIAPAFLAAVRERARERAQPSAS